MTFVRTKGKKMVSCSGGAIKVGKRNLEHMRASSPRRDTDRAGLLGSNAEMDSPVAKYKMDDMPAVNMDSLKSALSGLRISMPPPNSSLMKKGSQKKFVNI